MVTPELWQRLVERWRIDDIPIRPGVHHQSIADFESKYSVVLPPAVRDYFMSVDGTGDQMDDGLYRFWPLSEVKPVHEQLAPTDRFTYSDRFSYPDCFVFADHCINCWDYAVKLTKDPTQSAPVFRVTASDPPGEKMAESFLEFMSSYASNPDSII